MHKMHVPIRYSGATRCNFGWCSSAPGVHPKYHAPRLEATRMAHWMDTSTRCAPPEGGAHQPLASAQHATHLASGTAVPGVRFVLFVRSKQGATPDARIQPTDEHHNHPKVVFISHRSCQRSAALLKSAQSGFVQVHAIACSWKKGRKIAAREMFPTKAWCSCFSELAKGGRALAEREADCPS